MPGIYLTAVLTTIVAVAVFGVLIHKLRLPANEPLVWLAVAVALPLQPLAFYFVRIPLDHWLVAHLGSTSATYNWLTSFYAPLTEEPAKLVPLLIPAICRDLRPSNFVRYALAIGLGFAIGEMWFIAARVAQSPALAALPFYQFDGYVVERLMTCVFHSAFVSVALWRLRRRFALGLTGAMALHWLGNFPLLLMAWNVGGLGKTFWMVAVQFWLLFCFVAALALLSYFALGRIPRAKMFYGRRHCPGCDADYDAPLLALNFGSFRYERCPYCRRWHWTKTRNP
jgi:protease prsW family protein